jgi:DNA-binding beta-propeller fold protein YncE
MPPAPSGRCRRYNEMGLPVVNRRTFLVSGAAALAGCKKQSSFAGYAFVANAGANALAVVDFVALAVTRRVALGASPADVIAPSASPYVYVITPESGTVFEVDPLAARVQRSAKFGRPVRSMRLSRDGAALWVLTSPPAELVKLPLVSFKAASRIRLGGDANAFDISNSGELAAVCLGSSGSVAMADLTRSVPLKRGRVAEKLGAVLVRGDGKVVVASDTAENRIVISDAQSLETIVRLPLALRPDNLCFKADGGQLFVTGQGMDGVAVVYVYRTEIAQTVLAGPAPGAMAVSASPDYLFVANPTAGLLTVLEIDTLRVLAVTGVGTNPTFITITPDQSYALVLNHDSGDMALIRPSAITYKRTKMAPLFTMIPVGTGPVSAAVRST